MKKYYNNPELTIMNSQAQDILTTSGFEVLENVVERPNQSFDGFDIVLP